jgi:very-short-patch-repair endonuclease
MPTPTQITRARALRQAATPPERHLWTWLRTLRPQGHHFRRQAPFRGYILDFVCYRQRLVIEIDGAHHGTAAQQAHDTQRDAILAREGFHTLRFQATDVLTNLEGVATAIQLALAPAQPPPCK